MRLCQFSIESQYSVVVYLTMTMIIFQPQRWHMYVYLPSAISSGEKQGQC